MKNIGKTISGPHSKMNGKKYRNILAMSKKEVISEKVLQCCRDTGRTL